MDKVKLRSSRIYMGGLLHVESITFFGINVSSISDNNRVMHLSTGQKMMMNCGYS
jgi:hypothetical protein